MRKKRAVMLCGLLFALHDGAAADPPSAGLPDALKGIQPAGGACLRDEAGQPPAPVPAKVQRARPDLSCASAPADVARALTSPATVLVDVRPPADYAAFHIDGALNASTAELQTKRFLRGKAVVLVGTGKGERELYSECARLKAKGFREVRVLRGGLPAWLAAGQAVLGQPPNAAHAGQLSPAELWIESGFDANLVLVPPGQGELQRLLTNAVGIAAADPATVRAAVEQRRRRRASTLAAVVLAGGDWSEAALLAVREAIQPVPLLVYTDSGAALSRQLARQNAIWAAQARGPKQPVCGR